MAPTSTKRYFSLAFFLLAASMAGVAAIARNDDDEYVVPIDNEGDAVQFTNHFGVEDASAANADHADSDFMVPSTLEQVHVITRHGARTMLSKEADAMAEAGGVTLTPLGRQQLHDLGEWLRNEYLEVLGNPVTGRDRSLEYYNPNLHLFESSNLDRTLTSASALSKALFPGTMRASGAHSTQPSDPEYHEKELFDSPVEVPIPVYTTGKDKNDVTLRAYKNCPTFNNRLTKELYKSKRWKQLENENSDLLNEVAKWFPDMAVDGKIPLEHLWDTYDAIHVARTECFDNAVNEACRSFLSRDSVQLAASALSTNDFDRLEQLVEHAEFLKFGAGIDTSPEEGTVTAGHLLGSNLLWQILNRARGDGDFFMYSAHLPTLLGLLSTMQASKDLFRDTGGDKFFEYGSALIVEIRKSRDKGVYYFVLKYKSSESETAINIVMHQSATGIKCGFNDNSGLSIIEKANWCQLDEVVTWADTNTLRTKEAWCKACNNQEADVCLASKRGSRTSTLDMWASNAEAMGYTTAPGANFVICMLFFGGLSTGLILMGLVWYYSRHKANINPSVAKKQSPNKIDVTLDDSTSSASDGSKEPDVAIEEAFPSTSMGAEEMRGKEIC